MRTVGACDTHELTPYAYLYPKNDPLATCWAGGAGLLEKIWGAMYVTICREQVNPGHCLSTLRMHVRQTFPDSVPATTAHLVTRART